MRSLRLTKLRLTWLGTNRVLGVALAVLPALFILVAGQVEAETLAGESGEAVLELFDVRFSGNTVFGDDELTALVEDHFGHRLSLRELEELADRVTRHYRDRGYIGSQAYIPPQNVVDGIVEIAVLEGRYADIVLHNASRLRDHVVAGYVRTLSPGAIIDADELQQRISALSDTPGVAARSTLSPGAVPGAADLIVTVTDEKRFSGTFELENSGTRFTGEPRIGATLAVNNVAGFGDRLVFRRTTSGDAGFSHNHIGIELPLPRLTARQVSPPQLRLYYNRVEYALGDAFAPTQAGGWASTAAISVETPIIARRDQDRSQRVNATVEHAVKRIEDRHGPTAAPRRIDLSTLLLTGTRQRVGAFSQFQVSVSSGQLSIDSLVEKMLDAMSAKAEGRFFKANASYSLGLAWSNGVEAVLLARAQWASKNLDVAEKMSLGGPSGVRAYPSGEASGDDVALARLELRRELFSRPGNGKVAGVRLQATLFGDVGFARLYKRPWGPSASSGNERTLSAVGIGLRWTRGALSVSAEHGWKLGDEAATADKDAPGRWWLQATYRF